MKRAKKERLVVSRKVGSFGKESHWIWFLPEIFTGISEKEVVENYLQGLNRISESPEGRTAAPFGGKIPEFAQECSDAPFDQSLENKEHGKNAARRTQENCPQSENVRPSGEIADCSEPDRPSTPMVLIGQRVSRL